MKKKRFAALTLAAGAGASRSALRDGVIRPGGTCDPRALSCYTFEQGKPARICIQYAPAECFGILAGSGGDILFPADRGSLLYPCGTHPLYAVWGLYLMRVHC